MNHHLQRLYTNAVVIFKWITRVATGWTAFVFYFMWKSLWGLMFRAIDDWAFGIVDENSSPTMVFLRVTSECGCLFLLDMVMPQFFLWARFVSLLFSIWHVAGWIAFVDRWVKCVVLMQVTLFGFAFVQRIIQKKVER